MCTSVSNKGCGSNLTTNSLQPVECTGSKIVEWQQDIQQHNVLGSVARLFEVDENMMLYYQGLSQDMSCAKMILNSK